MVAMPDKPVRSDHRGDEAVVGGPGTIGGAGIPAAAVGVTAGN